MVWNVDPILFSLGPLTVRWYGLFFVLGFLIAFQGFKRIFLRDGLSVAVLDSLLVHVMLGTIIGARLGHCFFYEPAYFFSHPLEIFAVWKGGLASHGGFLGVFAGVALFCRRYKLPFLYILDRVAFFALITGGLIRIGNLMNSEIIGRPTDVAWAFTFVRVDNLPRHPTQIYESLAYLTIAGLAWWAEEKRKGQLPRGMLFGWILAAGFGARFLIEFFKENQEAFEKEMILNMGQLLSLIPILIGIALLIWSARRGVPTEPLFAAKKGARPTGKKRKAAKR